MCGCGTVQVFLSTDLAFQAASCASGSKTRVARVSSLGYVNTEKNPEGDLVYFLDTMGTFAVAYNAATDAMAYYKSGVIDVPGCDTVRFLN